MSKVRLVVIGSLAITSCAGSDPDTAADESGCFTADDCASLQFCHVGRCEDVLGRKFSVVISEASASTSANWDVGGGAPDPFVVVSSTGARDCVTSTKNDDFSPAWVEHCEFVLGVGGDLTIAMFDEDLSANDIMLTFTASGSDELVELVVNRTSVLSNDNASLVFELVPTF